MVERVAVAAATHRTLSIRASDRNLPGRLAARGIVLAIGLAGPATALPAQSLLERTPNISGVAMPTRGTTTFVLTHRFDLVGEEDRKVVNYPSFTLGRGLPASFAIGATYASNSELGAGTPNEWELWARRRFDVTPRWALAATAAWNSAAKSADGELAARVVANRLTLLGAVRGFSDAYASGDGAVVIGGGAVLRLTPRLALVLDAVRNLSQDSLRVAWSAGVHLAIPGSPHTLGFAVSNVGAPTLQGASRGVDSPDGGNELRYGFAFTAPLGTLSQWLRIFRRESAPASGMVNIRDFAFGPEEIRIRPGETVAWTNADPVLHAVTSDDGLWDSGLLESGEGYLRRFDEPGRYPYHCTPHPQMKGVVVVEEE